MQAGGHLGWKIEDAPYRPTAIVDTWGKEMLPSIHGVLQWEISIRITVFFGNLEPGS